MGSYWGSDACIDCQWCCRHCSMPIPGGTEWAFLFYRQGRSVFYEPYSQSWWVVFDQKCQYIDAYGCTIYEDRPHLCASLCCPYGPTIGKRIDLLLNAGQRIMREYERRGTYNGD